MRIVHFADDFHPDFGYQINILPKFQVAQGNEIIVVTSSSSKQNQTIENFVDGSELEAKDIAYTVKTGVKIHRLPTLGRFSGRVFYKINILKYIKCLKPDMLFCHSNEGITSIIFLLNYEKLTYPIIFDSHMLEMASKNSMRSIYRWIYSKFITPIIIKNNLKVIRTQNDAYVEKCLKIPLKQAPWISVGSDTLLFTPSEEEKFRFREELKIGDDDFVVVYAGKLTEDKGGLLLAETFKRAFVNNKNKKVVLLVIGNTVGAYGDKVEDTLRASENRVIRFATQKYIDLPKFYQVADLAVYPKQCSLSFYDVQACALPVISEDNNINIERLSYRNGFVFKEGCIEDFRMKVLRCLEMDDDSYNTMKINALQLVKNNYDYRDIAQQYTDLITKECTERMASRYLIE